MWFQKQLTLAPKTQGFHLVTNELLRQLPELVDFQVGTAHFFLNHTSASLTINENADPTVRVDLAAYLDRLVPENSHYFLHTDEGPDDMPAHIKSSLLGVSVNLPIHHGRLALGTWQGIYLGEHRISGGQRRVTVTLNGES